MGEDKEIKVESYAGYKKGETPRRVFINGQDLEIEYVVFRNRVLDIETNEYADHYRLMLKNYGECDILYREKSDSWELERMEAPGKPFSELYRD